MTARAVAFPDIEYVATRWCNATDAGLGGVRATTDLIGWTAGTPRIVLTRSGGVPPLAMRVDRARLDVDVYAATKAAAYDLAQAVRVRLHNLPNGDHTDLFAVVSDVADDVGLQWLPDPDSTTPRYVFALTVTARPHP